MPSQGGCTLGMTSSHIDERAFSLNEHIAEQKRIHRQRMLERSPRPPSSLSTSSLNAILPNPALAATNQLTASTASTTTGDDRSRSSTEESDSEEDLLSDNSSSELDTETGFLTPVSQKQRRALLKQAGVREIASSEKNECRDIRASREFCGCSCRDYCDPETCLCSRAGIKCQVSINNRFLPFSSIRITQIYSLLICTGNFYSRLIELVFHVVVPKMGAAMYLAVWNSIQNAFERISFIR